MRDVRVEVETLDAVAAMHSLSAYSTRTDERTRKIGYTHYSMALARTASAWLQVPVSTGSFLEMIDGKMPRALQAAIKELKSAKAFLSGPMNTKTLTLGCVLLAIIASVSSVLMAESSDNAIVGKNSPIKGNDKEFFEKAAKSGEKEVRVSQAVLPRLAIPEVKAFAQMMIDDHSAANRELKSLASSKYVTLPILESKVVEKWYDEKKNVDENYLEEMISDHKDAVDLFEKAVKSNDADVAAFASSTLPKLRHHLEQAKSLKKSVDR
jgi:putative membrane protein